MSYFTMRRTLARLVCMLALCFACPAASLSLGATIGQEQERCRIHGRVHDEEGKPIEGAVIQWIAPKEQGVGMNFQSNGVVTATTNSHGNYELNFSENDPMLSLGFFSWSSIVASANGYSMQIENIKSTRMLVDLPLNFRLKKTNGVQLHVVDDQENSLVDVEVRPAQIGDKQLPFDPLLKSVVVTDANGVALLTFSEPGSLGMVYLHHPELGHQCVAVQDGERGLVAKALPRETIRGRVKAAEGATTPDLQRLKILLFSSVTGIQRAPQAWSTVQSWEYCDVQADGSFSSSKLSKGIVYFHSLIPMDVPFAVDIRSMYSALRGDQENEIVILPATLVRGQILDADSGQGIENLFISHFGMDGRVTHTDRDGKFQFYSGPGRIQYFPSHTFGRYVLSDSFYQTPQQIPKDGVLDLEPLRMRPMSKAIGSVVDANGSPLPGTQVTCEFKQERFQLSLDLFADQLGKFRFYGIPDGTTLRLKAKQGDFGTRRPLSLTLQADSNPELKLAPLPTATFVGQVVDPQGKAIPNAMVTIRKAIAHQEESYSGTDRMANPLFSGEPLLSDSSGRFQSPATLDFDQDVSVAVDALGYRSLRTGWRTRKPDKEGRIDLEALVLIPEIAKVDLDVSVEDQETKQPIPKSRVLFLGAQCGLRKVEMESDKKLLREVHDTPQVVAAIAPGYQPTFQVVDRWTPDPKTGKNRLTLSLARQANPNRAPVQIDPALMHKTAARLLQSLTEPPPTATFHRLRMYYSSLAFTEPKTLVERIKGMKALGTDLSILQVVLEELTSLPESELRRLIPVTDGQVRFFLQMSLCDKAPDASAKEEVLSEALILTRQLSGEEQLYAVASLAETMLKMEMPDLAREILSEAWDNHKEIREILENGIRLERGDRKQGIARFFAPPFALVDRQKAMQLIELTAYADEIDMLRMQAITFLAGQDQDGWEAELAKIPMDLRNSQWMNNYCEKVGFKNGRTGKAFLKELPNSLDKVRLILHLVEFSDASEATKKEWGQEALQVLKSSQDAIAVVHSSQIAVSACNLFAKRDPELAEQFAFESLWLCEKSNKILPFDLVGDLAKQFASYDATIARQLIKPCFEDWSWLFGERDMSVIYAQIVPLQAAAAIDPEWCAELTEQLLKSELASQPSRRYEVVSGVVSQWRQITKNSQKMDSQR